ncbi:MAG: hypothetical protein FWC92_01925 [Defluviitaleaceae bacterium]|nr:hypothetical protein [Defluviitaleaceae bacterium]
MTKFLLKRLHRWRIRRSRGKPRRPAPAPARYPTRSHKKARQPAWVIPRRYIALMMVLIAIGAFVYSYYRFDRTILPLVLEAAELHLQAEMNNVINQVVHEIVAERNITSADFVLKHNFAGDAGPVLSINTVLVNDISNAVAMRISHRLNNMEPETVSVPMGMAFNLDTLAQVGPRVNFRMAPIGNALVGYDSRFAAVGINQVHFSVWLTIESEVRIIKLIHGIHHTHGRPYNKTAHLRLLYMTLITVTIFVGSSTT